MQLAGTIFQSIRSILCEIEDKCSVSLLFCYMLCDVSLMWLKYYSLNSLCYYERSGLKTLANVYLSAIDSFQVMVLSKTSENKSYQF